MYYWSWVKSVSFTNLSSCYTEEWACSLVIPRGFRKTEEHHGSESQSSALSCHCLVNIWSRQPQYLTTLSPGRGLLVTPRPTRHTLAILLADQSSTPSSTRTKVTFWTKVKFPLRERLETKPVCILILAVSTFEQTAALLSRVIVPGRPLLVGWRCRSLLQQFRRCFIRCI